MWGLRVKKQWGAALDNGSWPLEQGLGISPWIEALQLMGAHSSLMPGFNSLLYTCLWAHGSNDKGRHVRQVTQNNDKCLSHARSGRSRMHFKKKKEKRVKIYIQIDWMKKRSTSGTTRYTKNKGWSLHPTNSITGENFSSWFSFTCFSFWGPPFWDNFPSLSLLCGPPLLTAS